MIAQDMLNAFTSGRQFRNDQQDRQRMLQQEQAAQGMANTQGKIENAFMQGNPQQAGALAQSSGDAGLMQGVQQRQQGMQQATRDQDGQRNDRLGQFATGLAATPVAQRGQAFDAIVPELFSYGLTPDQAVDIRSRLVDPNQSDAVIAAYMSRSVSPDTMFEATAPQMQGQNEARVAYSGGVATQTLNPLGQQIAGETARSNMAGEGIEARNAATNARNADTRAAAEQRASQPQPAQTPQWRTLPPEEAAQRGFTGGEIVQENSRTGQLVTRGTTTPADNPDMVSYTFGAEAMARAGTSLPGVIRANERLDELFQADQRFSGNPRDALATAAGAVPFDGGYWERVIGTRGRNELMQATQAYESAIMPILSGAAVSESEARRTIRAGIPEPGDSTAILRQKAAHRHMMEGMLRAGVTGQPVNLQELMDGAQAIASPPTPGETRTRSDFTTTEEYDAYLDSQYEG
jgi:hypothetical protein